MLVLDDQPKATDEAIATRPILLDAKRLQDILGPFIPQRSITRHVEEFEN